MSTVTWADVREQTLGFGKHRGKKWRELPAEYLEYLVTHAPNLSKMKAIVRHRHFSYARSELGFRDAAPQKMGDRNAG